jgi:hypothetical protein
MSVDYPVVKPRPAKRAKVADEEENGDSDDTAFFQELWNHYQNFLDSAGSSGDDDDDYDDDHDEANNQRGPDIDELQEMIELVKSRHDLITKPKLPSSEDRHGGDDYPTLHAWKSRKDLLPVLMSVAYYHLADDAISQYLMTQQQEQQQTRPTARDIQQLLVESLEWFPHNAATWSMSANFGRMSQTLSLAATCHWYERAVHASVTVRPIALTILNDNSDDAGSDDDDNTESFKEWIELLVLNQVLGVEYEEHANGDENLQDDGREQHKIRSNSSYSKDDNKVDDSFENEYNDDDNPNKEDDDDDDDDVVVSKAEDAFENEFNMKRSQDEDDDDVDEDDEKKHPGRYSSSAVESTARFMCAMLWSMQGSHDAALDHLKYFPLTHRLHPNVWTVDPSNQARTEEPPVEPPVIFKPSQGILPPHLYDGLLKLFAPDSPYWIESDYANRGYYSYFVEYNEPTKHTKPQNLLEDVIVNHLLPRAQQLLDGMKGRNALDDDKLSTKICGFEWWAHTRPIQANLGHNLHFDTDESMLDQEGKVTHPLFSSVLYLTGGGDTTTSSSPNSCPGGATIILDETPDSEKSADICWQVVPHDNSFLIFPGDRLHGVLPCPGTTAEKEERTGNGNKWTTADALIHESWKCSPKGNTASGKSTPSNHRLTFMVGFWTRNVPATMKHRRLYGPCGPLPPPTDEHTWVQDIMKGYDDQEEKQVEELPVQGAVMTPTELPSVSPAWESFEPYNNTNTTEEPSLCIPHGIDHRFFVRGAPRCFRQSLFEDRETSNIDDEW